MEITEVRIKLTEDSDDRLQGFCSITFDNCFVVRDLKIIEGANGPFVAMPSRKLTFHCPRCEAKNHLRASYCNHCGNRFRKGEESQGDHLKLYADIAHPVNSECREMIQQRVIEAYVQERDRSGLPGYVSKYDDDYDAETDDKSTVEEGAPRKRAPREDAPAADTTTELEREPSPRQIYKQSAEPEPRPPHRSARPSRQDPQKTDSSQEQTFGEGIFD